MATTIVPGLGNSPLFTQGGVGAAPGYSALDRRRAANSGAQAGAVGLNDYRVAQRAAGAALSVDVVMGTQGAQVAGSSLVAQGLYGVPPHSATINEAVATNAGAANPRVDSAYLQVQDTLHDASGFNRAQVVVVPGTATPGATLDTRAGAGAAPVNSIRLADILLPAGAATVTTANIRDRRPWALGAHLYISGGGGVTLTAGAWVNIPALTASLECSGAALELAALQSVGANGTAGPGGARVKMDGVVQCTAYTHVSGAVGGFVSVYVSGTIVPPAGRHAFTVEAYVTNGVANNSGNGEVPFLRVREVLSALTAGQ